MIAKRPQSKKEAKVQKFIKGAGRAKKSAAAKSETNHHNGTGATWKPVMMKVPQDRLDAIDEVANDLRLSRTAFMMTCIQNTMQTLKEVPASRDAFVQAAITNWVMR